MKELGRLLAAHRAADGFFKDSLAAAEESSDSAAQERWHDRRFLHEQAYYVLLFAQLEAMINERCASVIERRKASPDWQTRRAWDTFDERHPRRIVFLDRVALLLDRRSPAFRKIMRYYEVRNQIAHGSLVAMPAPVPILAEELQLLSVALRG